MATFILPGTLGEVRDPMSGYFLLRRRVIDGAALNPVGYKILLEVLARGDYRRVDEVPFIFDERALGESKLGGGIMLKYLAHLVRISIETREAVRIVKYAAVGLTGAFVYYVALLWLYATRHWPLPAAALVGVALAIFNNFVWNEVVTFPEARRLDPSTRALFRRMLAFAGFSAAGAVLSLALIAVLVGALEWPTTPGVLAGILAAGLWNFTTNSNLTWRAWWNRKILSRAAQPGGADFNPALAAHDLPPGKRLVLCNLCGSQRFAVLYRGRSTRAPDLDPNSMRCTSLEHGGFTNIVQCSDCGLIYQNPCDDDETLAKLYVGVDDPVYERESGGRVRTFGRLVERLVGRHWPWYMRMHLVYFTRESMRRMLEAAGFEVLAIERHERIVSLRYFLEKASSLLPVPLCRIGRKLAAPFGNVYSVIQLGDIMNVFARR